MRTSPRIYVVLRWDSVGLSVTPALFRAASVTVHNKGLESTSRVKAEKSALHLMLFESNGILFPQM